MNHIQALADKTSELGKLFEGLPNQTFDPRDPLNEQSCHCEVQSNGDVKIGSTIYTPTQFRELIVWGMKLLGICDNGST